MKVGQGGSGRCGAGRMLLAAVVAVLLCAANAKKEDTIQDVTPQQLAEMVVQRDYVAVFWYKRACSTCDQVLAELETIDDDCGRYGVPLVRLADKQVARGHGVRTFPGLTLFRSQEPMHYTGDLMDEASVLAFLTSLEALQIPGRIEEVNAKVLGKVVEEHSHVAVVFYEANCRLSTAALAALEDIDDDAEQLGIAFVKLRDADLAEEYSLTPLPSLVYYRGRVPVVYDGDLTEENRVLTWLVENKGTADDISVIDDVTIGLLNSLVDSMDHLAVIFYDHDDDEAVLEGLETVDDDLDDHGVHVVKICDEEAARAYGIESTPAMVYFENEIPSLYDGDLGAPAEVLAWLVAQKEADEIEDVTEAMLNRLVRDTESLAVLFYKIGSDDSTMAMTELENIDDDCDANGISFVKVSSEELAQEYGLETLPALVYFEAGVPALYSGSLLQEEAVLRWLVLQATSDQIEDVTGGMLQGLVARKEHLAVLFYDRNQKRSAKVLSELENIDSALDSRGLTLVRVADGVVAKEYGLDKLPAVVYFEDQIPHIYNGDLMKEEVLLSWLLHHLSEEEIAEINDNMLDKLILQEAHLAVLFYDKTDEESQEALDELEKIDAECARAGIPFVKVADLNEAQQYGIDALPGLLYFEHRVPSVYQGELTDEAEVLKWLLEQVSFDTIERVTDEILEELINSFEYVVVYFSGECQEDEPCRAILAELENIDDDTDEHGMHFVTTVDTSLATTQGVTSFPALVLFRNGQMLQFTGDIKDEDKVLHWLTDEETLEIPNKIEEVNIRMLDRLLNVSENLAVFFYKSGARKSNLIITELENIDDECDDVDIDFVKISDDGIKELYDLKKLPQLVFFRRRVPHVYDGDLMAEDQVLEWLLDHKDAGPVSVIEHVAGESVATLSDSFQFLVVYFYEDDCPTCEVILAELETIDDEADDEGIKFVKTSDVTSSRSWGITRLPALVYFEDGVPSVYSGDISDEQEVLEWLLEQRHEDTIENINRQMLYTSIEVRDYLAVYFYTEASKECTQVLNTLEKIDDDAAEFGVYLVKMEDKLMAKKYGCRTPPGLVYFRRGKYIKYEGDLLDEEDVLDWLTSPENMELNDAIERVNKKMFERVRAAKEYLAVFFYTEEGCKQCQKVLAGLEDIDDEADANGIDFVKLDDREIAREVGVFALPAIVFYRHGIEEPVIYAGDLRKEQAILTWLLAEKNPTADFIEEVTGASLTSAINGADAIAVFFCTTILQQHCRQSDFPESQLQDSNDTSQCERCVAILAELENIDDDTDRLDIKFVKTQEMPMAEQYGVAQVPALLYFEHQVASVFDGDLLADEDVLQWLTLQRTEDRIEQVNKYMLERMLVDTHYLAVYFYKDNCKACEVVLAELETIDDDCDKFGIQMVKVEDEQLARRYGIKTLPALIYFRNGNPLIFDGGLKIGLNVLDWMLDEKNRELTDKIERVNPQMLEHMLDNSPYVAAVFYENDCPECDDVLLELENIDETIDEFGIDLVKVKDGDAAHRYGVSSAPALVYFRKKTPLLYEGDLGNAEKVSKWLTSQDAFEIKDEIEEVNRKMLGKLLDENDFVAVYFYERSDASCEAVLEGLETIDRDTDVLDITFVKISDARYAKQYGLHKLPAVAYFRKRFPSVFRGDLGNSSDVLLWLQKNRYRVPELHEYMVYVCLFAVAFMLYTVFLRAYFRPDQHLKTN